MRNYVSITVGFMNTQEVMWKGIFIGIKGSMLPPITSIRNAHFEMNQAGWVASEDLEITRIWDFEGTMLWTDIYGIWYRKTHEGIWHPVGLFACVH
jgi:hypothetical protein